MRSFLVVAMLVAPIGRAAELRVDYVRESLTGTHLRYQQFIDGIRVIGGERIEKIDREGVRTSRESIARRGFSSVTPRNDLVYVNVNGVARLARVERSGWPKPVVTYSDAATNEVLRVELQYYNAAARVFDANPVAKLNDPSLQDRNNAAAAVPDAAYSIVDLAGLASSGPLSGPNAQIVDTDAPFTTRAEASQSLLFDRSQPQFEEVNAYFHVDRSQRYLQSLGYVGSRRVVNYAIPIDAHAVGGSDNSFYASGSVRGQGELFFGDGGTDDAEDSDIMIHEFGHAIHDSIAPDAFNGSSASEARALAEGFGDYWAFSAKYAQALASGRDPFCIGDWDARCWNDDSDQKCGYPTGADCLRRVDSTKTMNDFFPVNGAGVEHHNGEIWSSALREVHVAMVARYGNEQGRRIADTNVIEALFGAPMNPMFAGQARKILAADVALNGGANGDVICRAMTLRQILPVGECSAPPRGDHTLFQSTTSTIHIDDTRTVDDVMVRVITDARAGRITLVAPDGTSVLLTTNPQADVTFGLNSLPAQPLSALRSHVARGDWKLAVEGAQLRSWSLLIRFTGDVPLTARPTTSATRKHIPAVAHVRGIGDALFVSDVQIYNRSLGRASLYAIFTPSGADGTTNFAAVRLSIEPHHVVVLNDVVQSTMQSTGTGQLELLGDTDRIIVNSRTYTPNGAATYGETIAGFDTTEANRPEIAPLENSTAFRSNIGVAEVGGASGVARFTFFDAAGSELGKTDIAVAPYSHAQIRVPVVGTAMRAHVAVTGNARVIAYASVVDNLSGDAVTIPASRFVASVFDVAIPTIHAAGAGDTNWRTDLWTTTSDGRVSITPDVGTALGVKFVNTAGTIVASRTYTTSARGTYGQYIPGLVSSDTQQELIGIEESTAFRTNIGVINFGDAPAPVTVIVYDAAGNEHGRKGLDVGARALQQTPLAAIVPGGITDARIEVRGSQIAAYASLIDNRTQDPSFIRGQN